MESNSVLQLIRGFCPPREKNAFTWDSSLFGQSGHLPGSTEKLIDWGPYKAGLDMPGLQAGKEKQDVGQCVTSATKALHYYKLWRTKEGKMVLKDSEMHNVSMPSSDPLVILSSDNWQTEEGKKNRTRQVLTHI